MLLPPLGWAHPTQRPPPRLRLHLAAGRARPSSSLPPCQPGRSRGGRRGCRWHPPLQAEDERDGGGGGRDMGGWHGRRGAGGAGVCWRERRGAWQRLEPVSVCVCVCASWWCWWVGRGRGSDGQLFGEAQGAACKAAGSLPLQGAVGRCHGDGRLACAACSGRQRGHV